MMATSAFRASRSVQIGYFEKDAIPVNGRFRNCFSCLSVTLVPFLIDRELGWHAHQTT
jgi:hypothetical protein